MNTASLAAGSFPSARSTIPGKEADDTYLTVSVAGHMCGIPVLSVRDVLSRQAITRIPLAPPEIAGSLNLRGRIVTVVDLRYRLALPNGLVRHEAMNVVVEREGELYSLLTDSVGEVLPLPLQERAEIPATLDQLWREVSSGIQRIDEKLIILLDVQRILCIG